MVETENSGRSSYEDLYQENLVLRRELEELRTRRTSIWGMLAETNRRLQASSASIKAAVSSLLNYDIFWDVANQHEFLQTIDASVDQASTLVMLLTLAFRLEAGSLELKRDTQELHEILFSVIDRQAEKFPNLALRVGVPETGGPVRLDYEYFAIALEYLFQIFEKVKLKEIDIQAIQEADHWSLQITGLDQPTARMARQMNNCQADIFTASELLSPENVLRLHVACQLLNLQEVFVDVENEQSDKPILRLELPA